MAEGLATLRIAEQLEGRPLEVAADGSRVQVSADFGAGETLVLRLR